MTHRSIIGICLALALAGCGKWGEEEKAVAVQAPAGAEVVKLSAEQAESLGIRTAPAEKPQAVPLGGMAVQGRVVPPSGRRAAVVAPFPGRLVAPPSGLPIVGQQVKQGDSLGWIEQLLSATESLQVGDRRIALAGEVERARQEAQQRQRDLERARKLYDGGVIPQKQLQQAELDSRVADNRLEEAQKAKAAYDGFESASAPPRRVVLRAPISGAILEVAATAGQQIDSSKPIFDIADLSTVWVEAKVFEEYANRARDARQVRIVAPADPDRVYSGRFISSTRQVDPASRTEGLLYAVENRGGRLALGSFVEVRLPGRARAESAPVAQIPASAVFREAGVAAVFIEKQPRVYERRIIETGEAERGRLLVLKGIAPGEQVVVAGAASLRSAQSLGNRVE
jgi:cobalt-zinc-cadmium efflux system membrane fusion protein